MGNVFAAEKNASPPGAGSPPMMGMPMPPVSPAAAAALATGTANKASSGLPNPGSFEDLFKKVKGNSGL